MALILNERRVRRIHFIYLIFAFEQPSCVRACDDLSQEFTTKSGIRQGRPLHLFYSCYWTVMGLVLSPRENSSFDICPGRKFSELQYGDSVVLLIEDPSWRFFSAA